MLSMRNKKTKRKNKNKTKKRYHKKSTLEMYKQLILQYKKH